MNVCKSIYLLVWKNFLFRKKHACATVWFVVLPSFVSIFLGFLLATFSSEIGSRSPSRPNGPNGGPGGRMNIPDASNIIDNDKAYPRSFIEPLIDSHGMIEIAYTPETPTTNSIMAKLKATLEEINNNDTTGGKPFVKLITYSSEASLEKDLHFSTKSKHSDFGAAIVFLDNGDDVYSYTLRLRTMDILMDLLVYNSDSSPPHTQYQTSGFRALQILLDKIIVQRKSESSGSSIPKMEVQQFPTVKRYDGGPGRGLGRGPGSKPDPFEELNTALIVFQNLFLLSFIICVPNIMRGIIHEKQSGIKELMKMMGLSSWMHWTGWMIDCLFLLTISLIFITFFLFAPLWTWVPRINGPAFAHVSISLWFFVLMLYLMASVASLFFISTFFGKPTIAIIAGICFYIVSYYGLVFILDSGDVRKNTSTLLDKMASSLFPNMALHWIFKIFLWRDFFGVPTGWSNIADPYLTDSPLSALVSASSDDLNLWSICVMLILDIIFYMFLTVYCVYFESVIPSEFGLTKPWYYPFQLSTWCPPMKVVPNNPIPRSDNAQDIEKDTVTIANGKSGFEEEPTDLAVGIEICDLSKKFGNKKVAVEGLSAKMYAGEVTALLGHNGAGKTTTLSILTGLYRPSSGTAYINGFDIVNQIDEVRKSIGLCPQHDLLFDELTVAQHLQFFGMLKGLTSSMAKQEAQRILFSLKLGEKSSNLASTLSGGQKRRLSLANSIVGGSLVLFLDEPTSGLDPEARREVWDLLLALRTEGRTIVLTTHFMEEADVLGDRIMIMAEGKIQCSGTPLFLKKCFGDGYTLTVTLTDKADKDSILSVVQKYISTASFKKGEAKSVSEVAITLPEESTKTSIFPDMFSDLTKNQQKLGILTIGLTIPSIDDVFVRVGELSHPTEEADTLAKEEQTTDVDSFESVKGGSLLLLMFWGLMIKLFIRNIRNVRMVLTQFVFPIAGALTVAILSSKVFRLQDYKPPTQRMSLRSYSHPITLCMPMSPDAEYMCKYFFETTEGIGTTKMIHPGRHPNLVSHLKSDVTGKNDEHKYIIAAEMKNDGPNNKTIKVMHSGKYAYSEPLALNAASNTVLKLAAKERGLDPKSAGQIQLINRALLRRIDPIAILLAAEDALRKSKFIPIIFLLLPITLAMLTASYLVFPSEERECKGKHLQMMTGVSPLLYWITSIICDLLVMALVACLMLICFLIGQPNGIFTADYGAGVLFIILMVYAFSVIPLSYLKSNTSSPSAGFSGLVMLHALTGLILVSFTFLFESLRSILSSGVIGTIISTLAIIFRVGSIFNPTFGLGMSLIKFAAISIENNRCELISSKLKIKKCFGGHRNEQFSSFGSCCRECPGRIAKCGDMAVCKGALPYLTWEFESDILNLGDDSCKDKLAGIGQELLWMFLFGVIYYILLFLMEYGIFALIKKTCGTTKSVVEFQANYPTDEDVIAEAERVHATVFSPKTQLVGNRYPITAASAYVTPNVVAGNAVLNSGDKNDDAVKSDEQQNLNEVIPKNRQDPLEIRMEIDSLVVQNLCKSYGGFAAVSNVSFGVKHGECFGLLGVNGAGKTTCFRMLTGDEFPSAGDAFVGNISLKNDRTNFVKQFGYCPQSDPLVPFMTGREMLNFYGRLRGVPPASLKRETSKWLDKLGLTDAGNLQCKTYSGGMKRRLSAGVALIGNPPIILLDEPTSGVDPVSRREFWKIISSVKDAGQAVIFTSHSMDECEALCSRLGIMVNGQFQCFGGAPHIKAKFGEGYTLTIKLKSNIPVDNQETEIDIVMANSKAITDLQNEIFAKYQNVFLKEVHSDTMQYQLLDSSMTWDVVFKIMEEIKAKYEIIDVYSIGETTLEQVFLTFARQQHASRSA